MYLLLQDLETASNILKKFAGNPVYCDTEAGDFSKITERQLDEVEVEAICSMPYPYLRGEYANMRTIQFYCPAITSTTIIVDLDRVEIKDLKPYIEPLHTLWANAPYDLGMLGYTTKEFDDIQLAVRTAYYKLPSFKMDIIAKELIPDDLYKDIDKKEAQKSFNKGVSLTEAQLKYCEADVVALHRLHMLPKVQEVMTRTFYKVDMHSLRYSIKYQQNGLIVDKEAVGKELEALPKAIARNEVLLAGVNPNSHVKVKDRFEELLGVRPATTDKTFLIRMIGSADSEVSTFAQTVFDQRRLLKRLKMLDSYNTNRCFTKFNPYGAGTGRFSANGKGLPTGINSQQVPRDLQYIFNADTKDTTVIHADYSTAELRAACSLMADSTMRNYLLQGRDLHKVSAMLADKTLVYEEVTKEQRQKGKAISFGLIFGMGIERFIEYAYTEYGVILKEPEAKAIKEVYQETYPDVTRYHMEKWGNYKHTPAVSPMGRCNMPRMGTDAINFSTQASIGEVTKLAVHYMVQDYGEEALDYIYNVVHDAIYLRVPKGREDRWAKALVFSMFKAWKEALKLPLFKFKDIPIGVEYEVGSNKPIEIFDTKDFR